MRIRLSAQYSPQTRTERKNMSYIDELGKKAKSAAKNSAMLSQSLKNDILATIAAMLENGREEIKKANELDIKAAHENNMAAAMVDRLTLTNARIDGMAEGVRQVAALPDPVGKILGGNTLPNRPYRNKKIRTARRNRHYFRVTPQCYGRRRLPLP